MANIKINNLNPAGSDLFADSESFMTELSDAELATQGGMTPIRSTPLCDLITTTFSTLCPY